MTDFERLEEVRKFLDLSYRQIALTLRLSSPQCFYDIKKGKIGISKGLAGKIQENFRNINASWLLTGDGEMLQSPTIKAGDNSQIVTGNENKATYNNNNALSGLEKKMDRFLEELDIKNKQIERQAQQIDKLLDMLAVQNGGKST